MSPLMNKPDTKNRRRSLRRNLPRAEKLLWNRLRNQKLNGLRFRRQYGVLNYVVDFYCPQYKLAIEIIGDVHGFKSRLKSDLLRRKSIESLGIKMLFYTNMQVKEEMNGLLHDILSNLPLTPSFIRRGKRTSKP